MAKKSKITLRKGLSLKDIKAKYRELLTKSEKSLESAGLDEPQRTLIGAMLRDAYLLGRTDELDIHREKLKRLI